MLSNEKKGAQDSVQLSDAVSSLSLSPLPEVDVKQSRGAYSRTRFDVSSPVLGIPLEELTLRFKKSGRDLELSESFTKALESDLGAGSVVLIQTGVNQRDAKDRLIDNKLSIEQQDLPCLLYTSPSPRDKRQSRMPSSA